jgi:hypothetical protein
MFFLEGASNFRPLVELKAHDHSKEQPFFFLFSVSVLQILGDMLDLIDQSHDSHDAITRVTHVGVK